MKELLGADVRRGRFSDCISEAVVSSRSSPGCKSQPSLARRKSPEWAMCRGWISVGAAPDRPPLAVPSPGRKDRRAFVL